MGVLTCTGLATVGSLTCTALATVGSLTSTGLATIGSLQCNGTATVINNLTVGGTINCSGVNAYALCWASGKVTSAGAAMSTQGANPWTVAKLSTGVYRVTFTTAHPAGANYTTLVTPVNSYATIRAANTTSTYFEVATFTASGTVVDAYWHFMVMNW